MLELTKKELTRTNAQLSVYVNKDMRDAFMSKSAWDLHDRSKTLVSQVLQHAFFYTSNDLVQEELQESLALAVNKTLDDGGSLGKVTDFMEIGRVEDAAALLVQKEEHVKELLDILSEIR
jgi:hypothetical protein